MATDFLLQEFRISEYALLPSENIFTMLSLFFYLNHKRTTPSQKKELIKWFWHTTLGERYSGAGFNKNIPTDIDFLKKLAHRKNYKYVIEEKINPIDFLRRNYRSIKKATSVVGYYLLLKLKPPRYLETGEKMLLEGAVSIASRKDRHHVFPQNLFRSRRIKSKWPNSLANICLLAANENQSIGDDHPKTYLKPFKKKKYFNTVMKSHLIPSKLDSGIWDTGFKQGFRLFVNQRSNLILKEIGEIAGINHWKLFEKLDEIKRI
jgi:hypothetical protein